MFAFCYGSYVFVSSVYELFSVVHCLVETFSRYVFDLELRDSELSDRFRWPCVLRCMCVTARFLG